MKKKFESFLSSLKNEANGNLIEAIKLGYHHIFIESRFGGVDMYTPELNKSNNQPTISNNSNYMQNKDNQYFPQTLSDQSLDEINKSQSGVKGGRTMTYPVSGRGSDSMQNPTTRKNLAVQNTNQ